jgi:hypothetical protein
MADLPTGEFLLRASALIGLSTLKRQWEVLGYRTSRVKWTARSAIMCGSDTRAVVRKCR